MHPTDHVGLVRGLLGHDALQEPLLSAARELPVPVVETGEADTPGKLLHLPIGCSTGSQLGREHPAREVVLAELIDQPVCSDCLQRGLFKTAVANSPAYGWEVANLTIWMRCVNAVQAALANAEAGELSFIDVPWAPLRFTLAQHGNPRALHDATARLNRELDRRTGRLLDWIATHRPWWPYLAFLPELTDVDEAVRDFVTTRELELADEGDNLAQLAELEQLARQRTSEDRHPMLVRRLDATRSLRDQVELLETVAAGDGWCVLSVVSGHVADVMDSHHDHAQTYALNGIRGWQHDPTTVQRLGVAASLWQDGITAHESLTLAGRLVD